MNAFEMKHIIVAVATAAVALLFPPFAAKAGENECYLMGF